MSEIKLDLRHLLGFKIVATAVSASALRSPKIGLKGCTVVAETGTTDAAKTREEA